jgi:hypothetical protein
MTRARGNALQNAAAAYLRSMGWVHAESAGAGRNGTDILGTPGIVWEVKTASEFRRDFRPSQWVRQSKGHAQDRADVPVVVYFPPGIGAGNVAHTISLMPTHVLMRLLSEAEYTPVTRETTAP